MKDYVIRSQEGLGDVNERLLELTNATFGAYDGVITASADFQRWYTKRPGMSPRSCFVAMHGEQIVSNAYVTVNRVRLGGEMLNVGFVDTVMTHPDHRRRGLARAVLNKAIEFMRRERLDASMLYTLAGGMPYRFYESLGYRELVRVRYYKQEEHGERRGIRGACRDDAVSIHECSPDEIPTLRRFLQEAFEEYDGFPELTDELWRWRREMRPPSLAVKMFVSGASPEIEGAAALAVAPIRFQGKSVFISSILDFTVKSSEKAPALFAEMVSRAHVGSTVVVLSAAINDAFNRMCESQGFVSVVEDAAMIKPMSREANRALGRKPKLWYILTESLIGI